MGEVQGHLVSLVEAGAEDHGLAREDGGIIRKRVRFGVADFGGTNVLVPFYRGIIPVVFDVTFSRGGRIDEGFHEFESVTVLALDLNVTLLVRSRPVKEDLPLVECGAGAGTESVRSRSRILPCGHRFRPKSLGGLQRLPDIVPGRVVVDDAHSE